MYASFWKGDERFCIDLAEEGDESEDEEFSDSDEDFLWNAGTISFRY